MIQTCPLCGGKSVTPVFTLDSAPLVPFVRDSTTSRESITAPLGIVSCKHCGHMFNRAFSEDLNDDMYAVDFLMNRPVHPSMYVQLEQVARQLDRRYVRGKRVLEIGAGTGHFARIMATEAESVLVIEPSRALTKDFLPEANIHLINDFFDPKYCNEPFDLIICRQVLEHVAEPLNMLKEMRAALRPGGVIYLEVPRAEFIEEHLAIIELHNAHVQYFYERSFLHFATRCGFEVLNSWEVKSGHDMGFLLRSSRSDAEVDKSLSGNCGDLNKSFSGKRDLMEAKLRLLSGRGGIYGANWQGTSFFWLFSKSMPTVEMVLDDNDNYCGYHFISVAQSIPIQKPEQSTVSDLDYLIITAHLHSAAIAARVQSLGFKGKLFEGVSLTEV